VNAWAKSYDLDAPKKIAEIIQLVEEKHASGHENMAPSVVLYAELANAWAKSKNPSKAKRAASILRKVTRVYQETGSAAMRPNVHLYHAVLNACSSCANSAYYDSQSQRDALKVAFAVFKNMEKQKYAVPDVSTYDLLFRAARNLLPIGGARNDVVIALFEKCKRDGFVGDHIVKLVKSCADEKTYSDMFACAIGEEDESCCKYGKKVVHLHKIPKDWRRKASDFNHSENRLI